MAEWRIIERDARDTLGEGTLWSARDNAVFWVDILAPALNRLSFGDDNPCALFLQRLDNVVMSAT